MKNYVLHSLAVVGAVSLIIMACSADNSASSSSVNTLGRYQISSSFSPNGFNVIDTETGVVKSYGYSSSNFTYSLYSTTVTQP
jgi:hypothetical protein